MKKVVLQVALDLLELKRAVQIAKEALAGGADWIEAGTPLIKSEGMQAIRTLREQFPDTVIVADMKIADTGTMEVEMAAKAGASIICILADADDAVIAEAVRSSRLYGTRLMADLINVHDPVARARTLEGMGVDIIAAHVGIDQQMIGKTSLSLLKALQGEIHIPVAVAGGLDAATAGEAVCHGADIVIVGGCIARSADVTESTQLIRHSIDSPSIQALEKKSLDEEIYSLFMQVSTPNISDAMHRKGALPGLISVLRERENGGKGCNRTDLCRRLGKTRGSH